MPELTQEQIQDITKRFRMHPIEYEERINTLDKPLIIESACPGWQPRFWGPQSVYPVLPPGYTGEGGLRFGAVPVTFEEQVQGNVDAVKMGVQVLHFHPRDPKTAISLVATAKNIPLQAEILERTFQQVDAITFQHTWKSVVPPKDLMEPTTKSLSRGGMDYITHTMELLEYGHGNKYCQGTVVLWPPTDSYPPDHTKAVQEGVRFMEEHEVKPVHKLRSSFNVREMKRVLIDSGAITKKPFILVHDMGHPFGWPMDKDPWMPIDMIASLEQTKMRIPDGIIGVFSGGRNWIPITMTAILAGVDLIRVGIEDCYWLYPHKDDVIESNNQAVKIIVDFCKLIGRRLATVEEARKIMGVKVTSKP